MLAGVYPGRRVEIRAVQPEGHQKDLYEGWAPGLEDGAHRMNSFPEVRKCLGSEVPQLSLHFKRFFLPLSSFSFPPPLPSSPALSPSLSPFPFFFFLSSSLFFSFLSVGKGNYA